jgi:hypothetical protein
MATPGTASAQPSRPEITDCWEVAVEPTSVAVRPKPDTASPVSGQRLRWRPR